MLTSFTKFIAMSIISKKNNSFVLVKNIDSADGTQKNKSEGSGTLEDLQEFWKYSWDGVDWWRGLFLIPKKHVYLFINWIHWGFFYILETERGINDHYSIWGYFVFWKLWFENELDLTEHG